MATARQFFDHYATPAVRDGTSGDDLCLSLFRYSMYKEIHCPLFLPPKPTAKYISRCLPGLLKEYELSLGNINKVFASKWLNDNIVVFGTKCNKLFVLDTRNHQLRQIPSLYSSNGSSPADSPCGIHCIDINPSGNLLATGGVNVNDVAIYKVPTFDPLAVGEKAHKDWIFDVKWLDDQFLVSGSRDSNLALWKFDEDALMASSSSNPIPSTSVEADDTLSKYVPQHAFCQPTVVKECKDAKRIRALAYCQDKAELASLSMDAYLHIWDASTFTQKHCQKLRYQSENVCLAAHKDRNLYAIGSFSHVTLVDPLSSKRAIYISLRQRPSGIRSLSFTNDILSIGTGNGHMYFYDLAANRLLELDCGHPFSLSVGDGWLMHDDINRDIYTDAEYPNAVYTHCYDPSGTRIFAAGGPLPVDLWGNYAGLFQ